MKIMNLTQHTATPEQIEQGVFDLPAHLRAELQSLLTFGELPSRQVLIERARSIQSLVIDNITEDCAHAMVGGAPFFMVPLIEALENLGIAPVFAFSKRVSVEEIQPDGSVLKKAVFKHEGFVQ